MGTTKRRIGIVGFGQIGSYVYDEIAASPELGVEVVFVHDVDRDRLATLPENLVLERIGDFASRQPDMVCELAHPVVSRKYGEMFLDGADYFLLSVTAMADPALEERLKAAAERNGRRLYIPQGGVMGLDSIIVGRDSWEEVQMVMKKNPKNLDFAVSGFDPSTIKGETVVYDGPTRGICPLFPRNVNTHATLALAGIGFDRTRSILIADPALQTADLEITARGNGVELVMSRSAGIKGVTGTETLKSVLRSICSTAMRRPGMQFC